MIGATLKSWRSRAMHAIVEGVGGGMGGQSRFFMEGYWWMPRAGGARKCYKFIYGQLRGNMWEYEIIRYHLVGGGRPAASYYKVIGRPRAVPYYK